ncbi:12-oxophytodienoate reductase [Verticillium alfalfae VaMs.102]|uniref:12-oxophytodienoate reductase n=1 Tax=Verticillium alfalfae (strain VaMs.102 / ATCC MYA-4576 / FGSC 10136) TaxID=526221 RepID=C9SD39_VERA1|nr:12-oxophytodienoate reductase [Verticillium alfalfae VaMs.102]EEY17004.1 12-oxophytodienoate reductase [Verticillium alfalfae VaMs.102]
MSTPRSRLFEPVRLGTIDLKHRIVLAPLTRYRNGDDHAALPFMQRYYADRASVPGTLVISEATGIAQGQEGQRFLPSFVTDAQVAAWKSIIEGVHAKGSFWFQQLWDQGRAADPSYAPEEMSEGDIQKVIQDYVASARRVIAAGGDGVEVHGAHGYLIDQFLSDVVNKRTDKWGGSVENRARLVVEVVKAVSEAIGTQRVGLRLSPYASFQGATKSDTKELNLHIVKQLKALDGALAYISLVEARGDPATLMLNNPEDETKTLDFILEEWDNRSPVIVAGGYTPESAQQAVDGHYQKWNVLVAFGRHFLANPDLVYRVENGIQLNEYNRNTFYLNKTEEGYNDYPFSPEFLKASA